MLRATELAHARMRGIDAQISRAAAAELRAKQRQAVALEAAAEEAKIIEEEERVILETRAMVTAERRARRQQAVDAIARVRRSRQDGRRLEFSRKEMGGGGQRGCGVARGSGSGGGKLSHAHAAPSSPPIMEEDEEEAMAFEATASQGTCVGTAGSGHGGAGASCRAAASTPTAATAAVPVALPATPTASYHSTSASTATLAASSCLRPPSSTSANAVHRAAGAQGHVADNAAQRAAQRAALRATQYRQAQRAAENSPLPTRQEEETRKPSLLPTAARATILDPPSHRSIGGQPGSVGGSRGIPAPRVRSQPPPPTTGPVLVEQPNAVDLAAGAPLQVSVALSAANGATTHSVSHAASLGLQSSGLRPDPSHDVGVSRGGGGGLVNRPGLSRGESSGIIELEGEAVSLPKRRAAGNGEPVSAYDDLVSDVALRGLAVAGRISRENSRNASPRASQLTSPRSPTPGAASPHLESAHLRTHLTSSSLLPPPLATRVPSVPMGGGWTMLGPSAPPQHAENAERSWQDGLCASMVSSSSQGLQESVTRTLSTPALPSALPGSLSKPPPPRPQPDAMARADASGSWLEPTSTELAAVLQVRSPLACPARLPLPLLPPPGSPLLGRR